MYKKFNKYLYKLITKSDNTTLDELITKSIQFFMESGGKSEFEAKVLLANELKRVGDYTKAQLIYKNLMAAETLKDAEKSIVYNNFASLMQDMGEYEKALKLYEYSLEISKKVLGEEHPSTVTTISNLAGIYKAMGEYEKALVLYEYSLEISKKVLGEEHPSTATTMNNLAGVYEAMGEYEKALVLYEYSLEISKKVLGEEHPSTATTMNNLAGVLFSFGRKNDAIKILEHAVKILQDTLGSNHPQTLMLKANLSNFKQKIKKI